MTSAAHCRNVLASRNRHTERDGVCCFWGSQEDRSKQTDRHDRTRLYYRPNIYGGPRIDADQALLAAPRRLCVYLGLSVRLLRVKLIIFIQRVKDILTIFGTEILFAKPTISGKKLLKSLSGTITSTYSGIVILFTSELRHRKVKCTQLWWINILSWLAHILKNMRSYYHTNILFFVTTAIKRSDISLYLVWYLTQNYPWSHISVKLQALAFSTQEGCDNCEV